MAKPFKLTSTFAPQGDQGEAIRQTCAGIMFFIFAGASRRRCRMDSAAFISRRARANSMPRGPMQGQYVFYGQQGWISKELVDLGGKDQRLAHDLARGAIDHYLSIAEENHAVGAVGYQFHVVRRHDDGPSPCPFALQKGHQRGLLLVVQAPRRLVEEHGGRLTVESTPGQGTRFSIELPIDGAGL